MSTMDVPAQRSPAGPGQRPVIADHNVVRGELLTIQVYCPDKPADFQEIADDLELAGVAS